MGQAGASDIELIKPLFEGIWSLEDFEDETSLSFEMYQKAIKNPDNYVLKPQKEGGGHNYFG
jgi:glutathione synthase